jgi:hypothetical protein
MFDRAVGRSTNVAAESLEAPTPGRTTLSERHAVPPMFDDDVPEWEEIDGGETDALNEVADSEPEMGSESAPPAGMQTADGRDATAERDGLPHREQLEVAFGEDLGGITAQTGADLSALDAHAAAAGDHVTFADSSPSAPLVAHEVAHVLQQRRGADTSATIAPAESDAEHEAEAIESRVAAGASAGAVTARPAGGVHLKRKLFADPSNVNREAVHSNRKPKGHPELLDRAGVRVRAGSHHRPKDKWKLVGGEAPRYRIVDGIKVEHVDTIKDNIDIALNPAHTRKLDLPGGPEDCVLVWARGRGAAWLAIRELAGAGANRVKAAVNAQAKRTGPAAPEGPTKRMHFVGDGAAKIRAIDRQTWIRPNHGAHADLLSDYLAKDIAGRTETAINVSQSLPQPDAAPIAIDFAQPGDPFWRLTAAKYTQDVTLFKKGSKRSSAQARSKPIKWVFGYLGRTAPDHRRRGWVPLRVLGP